MKKTAENGKMKKVLAIDDNPSVLRSIRNMLMGYYEVIIATEGENGISKALDDKPDVILLDYEMPGMDGKETFEKILKTDELKDIPVIFLTAVSEKQKVKEVLGKRPAAYILKPLDKDKMFTRIENAIELAELNKIDFLE